MESLQGVEDPVLLKGVIADLFHDCQKLTAEVKEAEKWKAEAEKWKAECQKWKWQPSVGRSNTPEAEIEEAVSHHSLSPHPLHL